MPPPIPSAGCGRASKGNTTLPTSRGSRRREIRCRNHHEPTQNRFRGPRDPTALGRRLRTGEKRGTSLLEPGRRMHTDRRRRRVVPGLQTVAGVPPLRGPNRLQTAKGPLSRGLCGVPEEGLEPPTHADYDSSLNWLSHREFEARWTRRWTQPQLRPHAIPRGSERREQGSGCSISQGNRVVAASGEHSRLVPALERIDLLVSRGTIAGHVPSRRHTRMASLLRTTSSCDHRPNALLID